MAQTTTFFEHANQMGIPHTTVMQLHAEGIETVVDLVDFNKDSLQQLADNLRRPGECVPDPNGNRKTDRSLVGSKVPMDPYDAKASVENLWSANKFCASMRRGSKSVSDKKLGMTAILQFFKM